MAKMAINGNPDDYIRVLVSCDTPVEVDKVYGPLCVDPLRVRCDFQRGWVVEQLWTDGETWHERIVIPWDASEPLVIPLGKYPSSSSDLVLGGKIDSTPDRSCEEIRGNTD